MASSRGGVKAPLVSVVMSVYNGEKYLREAIDSILRQTFTNFEFIIIDDGSTDDTAKIIKSYKDPRIVCISRKNMGLVVSLNEGINIARGKYIARQDADDTSYPDRLKSQVVKIEKDKAVLVSSAFAMISEDGHSILDYQCLIDEDQLLKKELWLKNPFAHGATMFRREAAIRVGTYRDVGPVEDYDLWMRLRDEGQFAYIPEVHYVWRINEKGISQTQANHQMLCAERTRQENLSPLPHIAGNQEYKRIYKKLKAVETRLRMKSIQRIMDDQRSYFKYFFKRRDLFQASKELYLLMLLLKLKIQVRPKRVLIIRNAYQHDFGGAETYALNLCIALKDQGEYAPILVTKVDRLLDRSKMKGVKSIKGYWEDRQGGRKRYFIVEPFITLWYFLLILVMRIDIVHVQGRDDFVFASRAAHWLRRRIIWTDHGDLKYIWRDDAPQWMSQKVKRAAQLAHRIIVVSRSEFQEIAKVHHDMSKFVVVHNGVFTSSFVSSIHTQGKKGLVFIATSRLVKSKGIGELIEAFSLIDTKNSQLWLVGDGPDSSLFMKQAKVNKRIKFLGYRNDVPSLLQQADVFVHPSYHEAFCLSLIEAAMVGLPLIATNTGGNPEIVSKDVGLLVPIKDAQKLAEAMNQLAQTDVREIMGKAAWSKAHEHFDFQQIVEYEIIPMYKE